MLPLSGCTATRANSVPARNVCPRTEPCSWWSGRQMPRKLSQEPQRSHCTAVLYTCCPDKRLYAEPYFGDLGEGRGQSFVWLQSTVNRVRLSCRRVQLGSQGHTGDVALAAVSQSAPSVLFDAFHTNHYSLQQLHAGGMLRLPALCKLNLSRWKCYTSTNTSCTSFCPRYPPSHLPQHAFASTCFEDDCGKRGNRRKVFTPWASMEVYNADDWRWSYMSSSAFRAANEEACSIARPGELKAKCTSHGEEGGVLRPSDNTPCLCSTQRRSGRRCAGC